MRRRTEFPVIHYRLSPSPAKLKTPCGYTSTGTYTSTVQSVTCPKCVEYLKKQGIKDVGIAFAMTEDERRAKLLENFEKINKANKEGYAGCLPNGMLVDRRENPEAHAIAENSIFNLTKPRCVSCKEQKTVEDLVKSICSSCRSKG